MRRKSILVVLITAALYVVVNLGPTAGDSLEPSDRGVNLANGPHFVQKSDRLEAIKRYILERLNVSDNRRFNRSAPAPPVPPPTKHHHGSPSHHHPENQRLQGRRSHQLSSTQSFTSLPEALDFYAKKSAEDGGGWVHAGTTAAPPVEDGVQRRRRRLHPHVDQSAGGGTQSKKRRGTAGHRHAPRKRRQRKQVKLTMIPDTGQNMPSCYT